jgi:hypothetical protein
MVGEAEIKRCFVISPIGEDSSETRKRADLVLKHIIKPAALEAGYVAERADEIDKPGLITSQVIQRVVSDPLVIADLTEMNPNVFYELALRHAFRRPLVQIIQKGERIPFDVAGTRTIHVDHTDLDSVASAKIEIVKQIQSLERDPDDMETPISVSLDLQQLRQSDNPEDRSLAEILSEMSELRISLSKISEMASISNSNELRQIRNLLAEAGDIGSERPRTKNLERYLFRLAEIAADSEVGPEKAMAYGAMATLFRDRAPWIYEAAMEVYKIMLFGPKSKAEDAEIKFKHIVRMTVESPISRDLMENERYGFPAMEMLNFFAR